MPTPSHAAAPSAEQPASAPGGIPLRPASQAPPENFYEAVGGATAFKKLVTVFYEGVGSDPVLRPLYPEDDLGPAADRLRMFLEQYWGGPRTYSEQRGHPRLRMRHAPFSIGPAERDAWLHHMRHALDSLELPEHLDTAMWDYMERAAHFMVNAPS